MVLYKKLC